jgi:hyaluronan synthase
MTQKERIRNNIQVFILFSMIVGMLVFLNRGESRFMFGLSVYGGLAISYLMLKLLASSWYKPFTQKITHNYLTALVMPFYNEDPHVFKECLISILDQTHRIDEIWVIDDCSDSLECYQIAQEYLSIKNNVFIHRNSKNMGKRHAQAWAFRQTKADIIITIDSDTVLENVAVENGLRPFEDPKVNTVCGNIRGLNNSKNLLTRLIDLRYSNAFMYERTAYSVLDSVICSTGVLSFWRANIIKDNLEDYISQTFLGVHVNYGDDRRLTNYALRSGKVVIQETARARTLVPEHLSQFLRQQIRWNKSFFRESLSALRDLPMTRIVWWLVLSEITLWIFFSMALVIALVINPIVGGKVLSVYYLAYISLMAYARSVRFAKRDFFAFMLAPVYGIIHLTLLVPLRGYSLLTLKDSGWGTRKKPNIADKAAVKKGLL